MADTSAGGASRRRQERSAAGAGAGGERRRSASAGSQRGAQRGAQRGGRETSAGASGTPPAAPVVDEGVTWQDLDRQTRAALRSLPKAMAERVGAHLAMAGLLVDDDPELAREHTDVARRLAGRVAVVREACALTAYACGDYDAALQELRAYRRMSGDQIHLPLMADCERGLGRPERALEIAASPQARGLPEDVARELRIVSAGARCDMGQAEAALNLLAADPALDPTRDRAMDPALEGAGSTLPASVLRLRYAYADTLQQLGRATEAAQWFAGVAAADAEGLTDAGDRVTTGEDQSRSPGPDSSG